jgi:hypothetical protein
MEMGRRWLEVARDVLFVDAAHDQRCETACLDCVLEFDVNATSEESLDRRAALRALDRILGGGGSQGSSAPALSSTRGVQDSAPNIVASQQPPRLSNEERLDRARERRQRRGR